MNTRRTILVLVALAVVAIAIGVWYTNGSANRAANLTVLYSGDNATAEHVLDLDEAEVMQQAPRLGQALDEARGSQLAVLTGDPAADAADYLKDKFGDAWHASGTALRWKGELFTADQELG